MINSIIGFIMHPLWIVPILTIALLHIFDSKKGRRVRKEKR